MELIDLLKEKSIKLTKPRLELIKILDSPAQPLTLEELHGKCKKSDFSSVFRNIRLFISLGIVEEINFGDRKPRYEMMLGKYHHHHIKCDVCGKIEKINDVCLVEDVKKQTNYSITNHVIEFSGVCPECRK